MTHERHGLPGLRHEIHLVQDEPRRIVTERNFPKLHARALPGHLRQRHRVGCVLPGRLGVDQPEDPLGAGHRHERLIVLVADDRNG